MTNRIEPGIRSFARARRARAGHLDARASAMVDEDARGDEGEDGATDGSSSGDSLADALEAELFAEVRREEKGAVDDDAEKRASAGARGGPRVVRRKLNPSSATGGGNRARSARTRRLCLIFAWCAANARERGTTRADGRGRAEVRAMVCAGTSRRL